MNQEPYCVNHFRLTCFIHLLCGRQSALQMTRKVKVNKTDDIFPPYTPLHFISTDLMA